MKEAPTACSYPVCLVSLVCPVNAAHPFPLSLAILLDRRRTLFAFKPCSYPCPVAPLCRTIMIFCLPIAFVISPLIILLYCHHVLLELRPTDVQRPSLVYWLPLSLAVAELVTGVVLFLFLL